MKITKSVLACLAVLAFMVLTTGSARAGGTDSDCASATITTCGFGTLTATLAPITVTNGSDSATITEYVFDSGGGVFTYAFTVQNTGSVGLSQATAVTLLGLPGNDRYNPNGLFGVETNINYTTAGIDDITDAGAGLGFIFGTNDLKVNFCTVSNCTPAGPGLAANDKFTFFVTGPDPGPGNIAVCNSGCTASNVVNSLQPLVEPSMLSQLSVSLLLMVAVPFVVRLRRRIA